MATEDGSATVQRNSLLSGVDKIGVLLTRLRVASHTQNTVLRLENDLSALRQEGRCSKGHTDTQVDIHAILELLRSTLDDALALLASLRGTLRDSLLLLLGALIEHRALNLLALCALNHALDVDALEVDVLWSDLAVLDDLVGLDNGDLCVLAHGFVEVVLRFAELAVAEAVGFGDLNKGVVAEYGFFEDVGFTVELAGLFRRGHLGNGAVGVVANGEFTRLYWACQMTLIRRGDRSTYPLCRTQLVCRKLVHQRHQQRTSQQ